MVCDKYNSISITRYPLLVIHKYSFRSHEYILTHSPSIVLANNSLNWKDILALEDQDLLLATPSLHWPKENTMPN